MSKKQIVITALALYAVNINSVYAEMVTINETNNISEKAANIEDKAVDENKIALESEVNKQNTNHKTHILKEEIKTPVSDNKSPDRTSKMSAEETGSIDTPVETKGLLGRLFAYFNE